MTRDEAKQLLPVFQAFAEGKTIEFKAGAGGWIDLTDLAFACGSENYRIKPEPDPYAELKAAYAAGKTIQLMKSGNPSGRWIDINWRVDWTALPERYRVKPCEPEPEEWVESSARAFYDLGMASTVYCDSCAGWTYGDGRTLEGCRYYKVAASIKQGAVVEVCEAKKQIRPKEVAEAAEDATEVSDGNFDQVNRPKQNEVVGLMNGVHPVSQTVGDKQVFATGAVRSADTEPVRFTLISPIAMSWIAGEASKASVFNLTTVFNLAEWSCCPAYQVGAAESQIYDFLSGGDSDDPDPQWVGKLARAGLAALMAIHLDEGGDKDYLRSLPGFDGDHGRYDVLPALGLRGVAEVYEEGAVKRGRMNWECGFVCDDLLERALRHFNKWKSGERSEPHLKHAGWNIFGAIHSLAMWPDLNRGRLRQRGCVAPGLPPSTDLHEHEVYGIVSKEMVDVTKHLADRGHVVN